MHHIVINNKKMKVTQEPISLEKVLSGLNFEIPLYQREYSWELEQIADLFYDIESSTNGEGYFLGSILLYNKDESKKLMEVIDGQQRLTTLFLILYSVKKSISGSEYTKAIEKINDLLYLRNKSLLISDTSEEPRLTTGKRDKKLFRAILRGEKIETHTNGKLKSHKLIINALENFIDVKISKLKEEKGLQGIVEFVDKLIAAEFIVMTAEQKSDKILLFKTLNARGVELSQSDLIKNELCNHVKGGITPDDAVDLWDEMREILEKVKANVDTFLFYFINAQTDSSNIRRNIEEKRNIKSIKDSYPPVPEKYVFDVYDEKLKQITDTESFLNQLKKSAQFYAEFYNPNQDKVYLFSIKALNISKCYPLLLRGKDVLNDKNFDRLCQAIECISFRHYIIRLDPKELEIFYYSILPKLNSDNDINTIIEEIKQHQTMKLVDKFRNEFIYASPKGNISKMILSRIVAHQQESIDTNKGDAWLEHIMPQKPKGEWSKLKENDAELYDFSINRLGNLTLLKNKLNVGASNKDFKVKNEEYYKKSRLTITTELDSYNEWDFNSIDKRQEKLYETAKIIWTI